MKGLKTWGWILFATSFVIFWSCVLFVPMNINRMNGGEVLLLTISFVCFILSITVWAIVRAINPSVPPIAEVYSFHAKVLEVHDKYMLVEHLPDGKTLSADIIEVPFEEKTSWPIPAVGDNVEVYCDGTIMETYPARLSNVYRVEILTIKLTS